MKSRKTVRRSKKISKWQRKKNAAKRQGVKVLAWIGAGTLLVAGLGLIQLLGGG